MQSTTAESRTARFPQKRVLIIGGVAGGIAGNIRGNQQMQQW